MLARWLGGTAGGEPLASSRPDVEFALVRAEFQPPSGAAALLRHGSVGVWRAGPDVFLGSPGGVGGRVDLDTGVGMIAAPRNCLDACWMAVHHCLRPLWFLALARCGLHSVHAAGVVKGHDAALILGSTGAGKSTLAARFVEQGASLLSDDTVLVDQETLEVCGFGDPSRLADGGPVSSRSEPDPDGKRSTVVGAVTYGPARPRLLLFLDARQGPEPLSRSLPAGDVMVRLLESGFLTVDPRSDTARLDALARLAESCPAFEVHRGPRHPSPATVRAWMGSLCASA